MQSNRDSKQSDVNLREKLLQQLHVDVLGHGSRTAVVASASSTCFQVDTHLVCWSWLNMLDGLGRSPSFVGLVLGADVWLAYCFGVIDPNMVTVCLVIFH